MEFRCPECNKVFRPHRFIAIRHPSQAKCPTCKVRGLVTEKGKKVRKSMFQAINQANIDGAKMKLDIETGIDND